MDMRLDQPDNFLSELMPCGFSGSGNDKQCKICDREGACLEWVKRMSVNADVPAQWLARMVLRGTINHCYDVGAVQQKYDEWESLWQF